MIAKTITVPFVRGKGRPRFNRKSGRAYTPGQTVEAEAEIARIWMDEAGLTAPRGVPVMVDVTVRRDMPKTTPKRVESMPDVTRPDLDNVVKLVLDALNGVAYEDDSQVVVLNGAKDARRRRGGDSMRIAVTYLEDWEDEG